jgi:hypothetical protein
MICKGLEGSERVLSSGIILEFARRDWEKPRRTLFVIMCHLLEITDLQIKIYTHATATFGSLYTYLCEK